MLAEVERRGGATPLTECSELRDAFRRRVGVAERESRPLEGPARRLREDGDLLSPRAEGDRSTAGLYVELGERARGGGVAAEGEVERESCRRDCRSSPSDALPLFVDILLLSGVAKWLGKDMATWVKERGRRVLSFCLELWLVAVAVAVAVAGHKVNNTRGCAQPPVMVFDDSLGCVKVTDTLLFSSSWIWFQEMLQLCTYSLVNLITIIMKEKGRGGGSNKLLHSPSLGIL